MERFRTEKRIFFIENNVKIRYSYKCYLKDVVYWNNLSFKFTFQWSKGSSSWNVEVLKSDLNLVDYSSQRTCNSRILFLHKVRVKKNETTLLLPLSKNIYFSQKSERIRSKWNVFSFNLRYSMLLWDKYDQRYD